MRRIDAVLRPPNS